jgi:predicted RNA-binding Zn ribbon-like protein
MRRLASSYPSLRELEIPPERQTGGREPAPGELALLQAFVNTEWNLDSVHEDRFAVPQDVADWLAARALLERGRRLGDADLERVVDVRRGLRELLFVNNGAVPDQAIVRRLNEALTGASVFVQLDPSAPPDFTTIRRDLNGALGILSTLAALAQLDGRWSRLKACRGVECGWTFYDYSRNGSANWCSMSVCGSRTKAREYRRRKRAGHERDR